MIVLVTGGSGCGKSTWAEKLIASLPNENRVYIATMQVYDEESVKRVERHRAQRADKGFRTIECEKDLASADIEDDSIVLLEDLVNLHLVILQQIDRILIRNVYVFKPGHLVSYCSLEHVSEFIL